MLLLFCGIPASGKTMIATEVAHKLKGRVIHIQSDILRQMIAKHVHDDMEDEFIYNAMNCLADAALKANYVVILDATYSRLEAREQSISTAKALGKKTLIIHATCPLDAAIRRNRKRNNPIPEEIIKKFHEFFEEPLDALNIDLEAISVHKAAEIILSKIGYEV